MVPPGSATLVPYSADCVRHANQVLVRVSGRLVDPQTTTPDWHECLQRLATADVRVDLGAVTEIDARGLGMLAELTRQTHAGGWRVSVVSASPRVRRLLEVTHLDGLLEGGSGGSGSTATPHGTQAA